MARWMTTAEQSAAGRGTVRFIHTPAVQVGPNDEVYVELATIDGSSVGLPANTIYVHPSTGRLYKTT